MFLEHILGYGSQLVWMPICFVVLVQWVIPIKEVEMCMYRKSKEPQTPCFNTEWKDSCEKQERTSDSLLPEICICTFRYGNYYKKKQKRKKNFEAGFLHVLVFQVTFSCLMNFCLYILLCIHPFYVNSSIAPGIYNLSYVMLFKDHVIIFAKRNLLYVFMRTYIDSHILKQLYWF